MSSVLQPWVEQLGLRHQGTKDRRAKHSSNITQPMCKPPANYKTQHPATSPLDTR